MSVHNDKGKRLGIRPKTFGPSAVRHIAGISVRTLKRWEDLGILPSPKHNDKGHRFYYYGDIIHIMEVMQKRGIKKNN